MKNQQEAKVLFMQRMMRRRNPIKEALLNFFYSLSSWPRLFLETVIRRDFGERYFSFSGTIAITVLLGLYPIVKAYGLNSFAQYGYVNPVSKTDFILHYFTWYVYLCVFMYMAIQRRNEIKRLPWVFYSGRYSLSKGYSHPMFFKSGIHGKKVNVRQVETLLEPGAFFVAGFVLWSMGQSLGSLLMICSVFYSLSYVSDYQYGDNLVLDMRDDWIASQNFAKAFIEDVDPEQTSGFQFRGRRPVDQEGRERIVQMLVDDEIVEAF